MKRIVFSCLLVVSLFANVFLVWVDFFRDHLTQNQAVDYTSTVQAIDQANNMIHQVTGSNGSQEGLQLFQAYNSLVHAQLLVKNYEQSLSNNGILVSNLETLLDAETSDLRLEFGNQIAGKAIDQNRFQNVEKNLTYLSSTLPHSYSGPTQEMKDAFAKLVHQE